MWVWVGGWGGGQGGGQQAMLAPACSACGFLGPRANHASADSSCPSCAFPVQAPRSHAPRASECRAAQRAYQNVPARARALHEHIACLWCASVRTSWERELSLGWGWVQNAPARPMPPPPRARLFFASFGPCRDNCECGDNCGCGSDCESPLLFCCAAQRLNDMWTDGQAAGPCSHHRKPACATPRLCLTAIPYCP